MGVIPNLALVFGAAVIWPRGLPGGTSWFALLMGVLAFIALYRFRMDVPVGLYRRRFCATRVDVAGRVGNYGDERWEE
jgi:hypothetical protein